MGGLREPDDRVLGKGVRADGVAAVQRVSTYVMRIVVSRLPVGGTT